jgi:hypothetical protein
MSDEFYVGYLPKAPAKLARRIARVAIGLVLAFSAIAAAFVLNQAPYAASRFEYGWFRQYRGVIEELPYPMLQTHDSTFLLVAPGKHGLSGAVRGLQGKAVKFEGSLIERAGDRMLEVRPESLHRAAGILTPPAEPMVSLGEVKLRGEIVDSKCYLGVMNPGEGKVHRDCAARCISGGVPPVFIVRDGFGATRVLLLTGSDGRHLNGDVLSYVAEPLEIEGELLRRGSHFILKTETANFHR